MTGTEIAQVVGAVVVPFLSVTVAAWIAEKQANRRDARDMLIKVNVDAERLGNAAVAALWSIGSPNPNTPGRDSEEGPAGIRILKATANADLTLVNLMFGTKADPLANAIGNIIESADLYFLDQPPRPYDVCDKIAAQVQTVKNETKQLWGRLKCCPWLVRN